VREVKFARYRRYEDARVDANNSMIALLAGSRLAAHSLRLHEDSPHQLPGLFPKVRDIDRFNLLPERATALLNSADSHLAAVAIPYALAVYEAFVIDAVDLLEGDGKNVNRSWGSMNAVRMHDTFYAAAGSAAPVDTMALFHVLRVMRNAQIHRAGVATPELVVEFSKLNDVQRRRWEKLIMAPIEVLREGDPIAFTIGHLVASFAVTKEAARVVNEALAGSLSREFWSGLTVEDFEESAKHPRNSSGWRRGLVGFAAHYYRPLALTEQELQEAARRTGAWTLDRWS
jgi:hypothetical protein